MANVFKPKRSSTASSVPTTSNLVDGELAVNIPDKQIYIRNGNEIVELIGVSTSIVGDTSPQLGGNLDLNSKDITGTGNIDITGNLSVTSTDADSGFAPYIDLYRNSPSPDVSDTLGRIRFYGENDADEKILYGYIQGEILDETDGTEDGIIKAYVITNGTNEQRFSISGNSFTKFFNKSVLLTSGVD